MRAERVAFGGAPPPLSRASVHLWRIALDQPTALVDLLATTLSDDERLRADRYHFEHDRRRFVVARGALRALLGLYSGLAPREVGFVYGSQGKPALVPTGADDLRFNLSHSHELAVCAVTRGREIGVDLERIRPLPDLEQIAAQYFSARENATLCALPAAQRTAAFFDCWTRKEAYVKATGQGLTLALDAFDVSLAPGEAARLLRVAGDLAEVARWRLQALAIAAGYAATLAAEGQDWEPVDCAWLA